MAQKQSQFKLWLLVLAGLLALGSAMSAAVWALEHGSIARLLLAGTAVLADLWLLFGLWCWRERRGVIKAATFYLGTHAVVGLFVLLMALDLPAYAVGLAGLWGMVLAFVLGLGLLRLVLSIGRPAVGVARTLVDEAIRMKIGLVFIVLMVLIVPLLFWGLDPAERLNYRIIMFLTWSLGCTSVVLSLMTVFLSCWTVSSEINQKQIHMTLTKPIGRWEYLLGKWLGVMGLNALLLAVAGVGIYAFAVLLQQQPARDALDRSAVDTQVLVARSAVSPVPPEGMSLGEEYNRRLEQLRREDPERYREVDPKDHDAIQKHVLVQWHTIPPRGSKAYLFRGLGEAARYTDRLQLRFKAKASQPPADEVLRLGLVISGRPWPMDEQGRPVQTSVADNTYFVIDLPVEAVSDKGDLHVQIINLFDPEAQPSSVSFTPGEGLEVLYQVDTFGRNLARTLVILWVRLSFLAILGLTAGTFLGFPVACLFALMVFFGAVGSSFLVESLHYYSYFNIKDLPTWWDKILWVPSEFFRKLFAGEIWDAVKIVIRLIGSAFVAVVPPFNEYNPVPLVSDGRLVSMDMVVRTLMRIGVAWTLVVGLLGLVVFRKREIGKPTQGG